MVSLYDLAQRHFSDLLDQLNTWNVPPAPGFALKPGNGLLCHYNRHDGMIYFCPPDNPLTSLMLMAALNCSADELNEIFELLLPWLLTHEVAHHLRHHYGVEITNWWYEEQIANLIAMSIASPANLPPLRLFLDRAINALSQHVPDPQIVLSAYSLNPNQDINRVAYQRSITQPLNDAYAHHTLRALYCSLVWLRCQISQPYSISPEAIFDEYILNAPKVQLNDFK